MFIIKVSTPWNHTDYNTRISNISLHPDFIYDFSDKCIVCDFWIIWGGIKGIQEKVECPIENIIFITEEAHINRIYNQKFLNQFASVITNRPEIEHKFKISSHELNTWIIEKDYDWLYNNKQTEKNKNDKNCRVIIMTMKTK